MILVARSLYRIVSPSDDRASKRHPKDDVEPPGDGVRLLETGGATLPRTQPLWLPTERSLQVSLDEAPSAVGTDPAYFPTDPPDPELVRGPSLRQRCITPALGLSERPTPRVRRDRAVLVRLGGLMSGRLHSLVASGVSVGRQADASIAIDDVGVSRKHARLFFHDGEWRLEDLGSKNGTYVEGHAVERSVLSDGTLVRFGPAASFRFQLLDAREEAALKLLYETSHHDQLTGMYNRRYLDVCLGMELAFATRHKTALSLVLVDIDRFKLVNDTYGHQVGDEVLKHVAALIRQQLRAEDVLARYGGEEFAIVLRDVGSINSAVAAERLRQCVEREPLRSDAGTVSVTLSAGCAALDECERVTRRELVALADRRLYEAKRAGRNRVVMVG